MEKHKESIGENCQNGIIPNVITSGHQTPNVPDKRNVPAIRFVEYTEDYARTTLGKIGNTYNGLTGKSAEDFGQGFPYIIRRTHYNPEQNH